MTTTEKWGIFQLDIKGPETGNPFTQQNIQGTFKNKNETVETKGFYDGCGSYKIRFMPSFEGEYSYEISCSFSSETVKGSFTAVKPSAGNHGPVRSANTYHLAYEDGTPYYSMGTTCYVWELQNEETIQETLDTLSQGYFNKIRFCIFPKHYVYNFADPKTFPYEGTPVDNSNITEENFWEYSDCKGNHWDFERFNPEHFQNIEKYILELQKLGIEADIIVMHPYDRWGFSKMPANCDDLYWKYVLARFSAYRNVWWSLANEYDLMKEKSLKDWERFAAIICANDPYSHLRSIHNCGPYYDYTRPWITHCSMQRQDLYRHVEYTSDFRTRYGKPIVWDEIAYEGNIEHAWGNISGQELVRRFWEASLRGGYAGHGETYLNPDNILWWSHGGKLHGESPERIKFLHSILSETPGIGLKPGDEIFGEVMAVPESCGYQEDYELHYYGFCRPSSRQFSKKPGIKYKAEVIDTWEMTINSAGVFSGKFIIPLPGKEYMAIRLVKI